MTAQIIDLACANCGEPISAGQLVAVLWDGRRIHMSADYFTGECPELPTAPLCLGSSRAAAGAAGTAGGVDVHPPETSAARPSIVETLAEIDRLREERDDARALVHDLTSRLSRAKAELAQHQRHGW